MQNRQIQRASYVSLTRRGTVLQEINTHLFRPHPKPQEGGILIPAFKIKSEDTTFPKPLVQSHSRRGAELEGEPRPSHALCVPETPLLLTREEAAPDGARSRRRVWPGV